MRTRGTGPWSCSLSREGSHSCWLPAAVHGTPALGCSGLGCHCPGAGATVHSKPYSARHPANSPVHAVPTSAAGVRAQCRPGWGVSTWGPFQVLTSPGPGRRVWGQPHRTVLASEEGLPPPPGPTGTSSMSRSAADPQLDPRHTLCSLSRAEAQDPGSSGQACAGREPGPKSVSSWKSQPHSLGDSRPRPKARPAARGAHRGLPNPADGTCPPQTLVSLAQGRTGLPEVARRPPCCVWGARGWGRAAPGPREAPQTGHLEDRGGRCHDRVTTGAGWSPWPRPCPRGGSRPQP